MSSDARALAPTPTESVTRILCDLRMGLPCMAVHGTGTAVFVAVETVTERRLEALYDLFGAPELVLTAHRALAVVRPAAASGLTPEPVRIRPPENAQLAWFRQLADPASDASMPQRGPLHLIRENSKPLHDFTLKMAKSAELLPAVLLFTRSPTAALPENLEMSRVDVPDVSEPPALAPPVATVASAVFPLQAADAGRLHVFRDPTGLREHYALEIGTPGRNMPVLTRLHSACFTGDVLGSLKCDCGPQLRTALDRMGEEGSGVLLYLNQEGRGIGLANKMRVYDLQSQGMDTVDANHALGYEDDERDFTIAAMMMRSLGFSAARLLTNNPAKVQTFRAQGITITEQVPLQVGKNHHNSEYLATKALKSGHLL